MKSRPRSGENNYVIITGIERDLADIDVNVTDGCMDSARALSKDTWDIPPVFAVGWTVNTRTGPHSAAESGGVSAHGGWATALLPHSLQTGRGPRVLVSGKERRPLLVPGLRSYRDTVSPGLCKHCQWVCERG